MLQIKEDKSESSNRETKKTEDNCKMAKKKSKKNDKSKSKSATSTGRTKNQLPYHRINTRHPPGSTGNIQGPHIRPSLHAIYQKI